MKRAPLRLILSTRFVICLVVLLFLYLFSDFVWPSVVKAGPSVGGGNHNPATATNTAPATCDPPPSCTNACKELLAFIREQRNASGWSEYYDEIAAFLKAEGVARDAPATIVEIGTAWGGLASRLLERLPLLSLVAVDPFLPYDPGDIQSRILERVKEKYAVHGSSETGSELWARAMRFDMGAKFGCRYALQHKMSTAAADEVGKEPLKRFPRGIDAAFIDGDHSYRGIETDLSSWSPLVRRNGLLLFNDYG